MACGKSRLSARAALIRVQHHKPDPLRTEELAVEEIDADGERVEALQHIIWEFKMICEHPELLELLIAAGQLGRPQARVPACTGCGSDPSSTDLYPYISGFGYKHL